MKILFSEGSSTSARQTLYALGERHAIDICDSCRLGLCRYSRFVRRWHRGPAFPRNPLKYLDFVTDLVHRHRFDVLLPVHDQVYLFSRFRDRLAEQVGLAVPDFDALRVVHSKVSLARLLDELKLKQPEFTIAPLAELDRDFDFPCFVKLPLGSAGRGVWKVESREQLQDTLAELRATGTEEADELLVQQPAGGEFGVVQALFQHGRLVASHCYRARAFGAGGSAVARESVLHPKAKTAIASFGKHLTWHGALHAEYFLEPETDEPCFIDINPRIGETLNATLAGTNLSELLLRVSVGDEVAPQPESRTGVRTHAALTAVLGQAEDGAGRIRLLKEILRMVIKTGEYANSEDELARMSDHQGSMASVFGICELLVKPSRAKQLINSAVARYGLNAEAAKMIEAATPEDRE